MDDTYINNASNHDNPQNDVGKNLINKYIVHKPLQYGKKLYIVEFLAERTIQLVAFVSILAIAAIFYYVFQEATYAFKKPDKKSAEVTNTIGNTASAGTKQKTDSERPAAYSPDEPATNDLKPQPYDSQADASSDKPQEYKPDSYSPDGNKTNTTSKDKSAKIKKSDVAKPKEVAPQQDVVLQQSASSVESSQENQLYLKSFITPNDYIDNKPQYIWQPVGETAKYSFVPLFLGAFKVTVIGLVIAAPLAILAAIFTVAFAPKWLKEILKPSIEILAGFPSVVIGFFCLMTLATVMQNVFHTTFRLNSFVGGIGMALAVIPIIYTVTEDALNSVPNHLKEASLALGATRWETAYRVILPAATPGVFAAIILGFGRAFGETMIALMATGNAALVSADIFESVRTLAATIGSEMAEVEFRGAHYGVLFLIGAVLFVITFSLNAIAEFYVRKRLLKRFQGN